ncbi:MAG: OPT/YSL family transporter [Paenibacillus sp.]|nr:OPT/YSL family transporter [Paenibacillus sp.]
MELMTESDNSSGAVVLNGRQLILWSLGVAFFGVFFAVPLRKQTIIREKLKFPSGTATAQMIGLLHQRPDPTIKKTILRSRRHNRTDEIQPLLDTTQTSSYQTSSTAVSSPSDNFEYSWTIKLRGLLVSFLASSFYTVSSYFIPGLNALPVFNWITFNLIDFKSWQWYFTPSFSYIGQGIIMGLPTTLSMLLGCVVGWGILSPVAFYAGWAPGPVDDWKTGSKGWILWISLGVMIADSCVSLLVVLVRSIVKLFKPSVEEIRLYDQNTQDENGEEFIEVEDDVEVDAPKSQQVPTKVAIAGLILSTISCVYLIRAVFGPEILPKGMTLLAVIVAMFLSILGVRALGETDLNPVTGISKISQVLFAGIMPGSILANLIAGGIAEAGAQQAGKIYIYKFLL